MELSEYREKKASLTDQYPQEGGGEHRFVCSGSFGEIGSLLPTLKSVYEIKWLFASLSVVGISMQNRMRSKYE